MQCARQPWLHRVSCSRLRRHAVNGHGHGETHQYGIEKTWIDIAPNIPRLSRVKIDAYEVNVIWI
jgi:hypothetical protein